MLKVKATEQKIRIGKYADTFRYVMQPEMYAQLAQDKVIKEAALRSGVSRGIMQACWDAAGEVIKAWATEGHSVPLPGLGTVRFSVRSKAVENLEDVKTNLINSRRIVFTPSTDVKDELADTSIQITCLDEDGTILKRVTSDDGGEVEDPDNDPSPNSPEGEGTNTGGTGGDNGGGGGQN